MAVYYAPRPKTTWFQIGIRVFFPPILIWDLLKFTVNAVLGKFISVIILPAQLFKFTPGYFLNASSDALSKPSFGWRCWVGMKWIAWRIFFPPLLLGDLLGLVSCKIIDQSSECWSGGVISRNYPDLTAENHAIYTHDGAYLDTLEISHNEQKKQPPHQKKYIIRVIGNGDFYENKARIFDMRKMAREHQCSVIAFNYRNVGNSTGSLSSEDDLVTDVIAQIQRVLDEGGLPHHILIDGTSLGGAIAALVVKHFMELGIEINLFNDRSLSSVTKFVEGMIRRSKRSGHKQTTTGIVIGWILKPLIKLLLVLSKWDIPAGDAYHSLPDSRKEYMLLRSKKAERLQGEVTDDRVITHHASLHENAAMRKARKAEKAKLKREILEAASPQDKIAVQQRLANLKARKMDSAHLPADTNGHSVGREELRSQCDPQMTGEAFFNNFVYRVFAKNQPIEANDAEVEEDINETTLLISHRSESRNRGDVELSHFDEPDPGESSDDSTSQTNSP